MFHLEYDQIVTVYFSLVSKHPPIAWDRVHCAVQTCISSRLRSYTTSRSIQLHDSYGFCKVSEWWIVGCDAKIECYYGCSLFKSVKVRFVMTKLIINSKIEKIDWTAKCYPQQDFGEKF